MSFTTAVKTCFKKYATFSGTALRPEYWWFALFNFVVDLILVIVLGKVVENIYSLAVLIPGLAVAVRRLHDTRRSAWYLFTFLIPPWGIVLLCLPGRYDNNPYVSEDGVRAMAPSITEASVTTSSTTCPSCGKMRLPGQNYCQGCGAKFADE